MHSAKFMKQFTQKVALAAITMLSAAANVNAQYISEAPAGGFDFSTGKDYVIIYAPDAQVTAMGDKVLSNQNLDPAMEKNQFYSGQKVGGSYKGIVMQNGKKYIRKI